MGDQGKIIPIPALSSEVSVIAEDPVSRKLLELAANVARTPSTVLLTGESGVGKEVIARYIHQHSDRSSKDFVGVNCAALPATLLESELFGHEKGAFSGAIQRHTGLFERAQHGTILLDEISEMALELQAKLLRVLQERKVFRVGSSQPIELDVRVIATTNRDLKQCVDDGTFRLDLYYRLNVFPIHIPSLRERPADVEPLTLFYLAHFIETMDAKIKGINIEALQAIQRHPFPGNVRELTNVMERAVILARDQECVDQSHIMLGNTMNPGNLAARFRDEKSSGASIRFVPGAEPLTDVRMRVILSTLSRFDGNRTRTAEALGVSLRTIRNKLRDYREKGISIPE